jgi:2-succinyl-5-enolpyruvyl-6-hydroxy-3-cyclohexene-1-carboxylate synthase
MSTAATLLGEWSRVIAATLVDCGVREVVVSPGSRSTPFVVALAAREELACIDVIDERAAGFVALGMARASGRAVAMLCTSGTAGAHWYPAVIEAALCEIPLIAMTADRPLELAGCAAAQTIDQTRLFGEHVRGSFELGSPDPDEGALRGLRRTITQAVHRAQAPRRGPVHLNLRARKPLEPREPTTDREHALRALVDRVMATPITSVAIPVHRIDELVIDAAAAAIARATRPLIVAGPLPVQAITDGTRASALALARAAGAPMFTEATSQLRFTARPRDAGIVAVDAADLVFGASNLAPDLVVQLGGTPTSSGYEQLVASRPDLTRIVVGVGDWTDPHGTARAMLIGDRGRTIGALADAIVRAPPTVDEAWRERLRAADRRAWSAIEEELETGGRGEGGTEGLSEGAVARAVAASLPERAFLAIGNSLPIRILDRYVPGGTIDVAVLSQRGANGIDGLVSGAIGSSLALGTTPGAILLGDLSVQHDIGALASASLLRAPLAIVVVQNGGGRIFELLPVAQAMPELIDRFVTPQTVRLEHAAAAFGVPYEGVGDPRALRGALARALSRRGATLIEARVPQHGARDAAARIRARLAGEVAS